MTQDIDYDALGYVRSSGLRVIVVEQLTEPMLPSELAEETAEEMAHISRALNELREKDIVELLVSEDTKKGRLYGLTEKGEKLQKHL